MPQIISREGELAKRKNRIAGFSRGPGTFVYDGSHLDSEWEPTVLRAGKNQAVFDAEGLPVTDANGEQVFEKTGKVLRHTVGPEAGKPMLGGVPKKHTKPIELKKVRGVAFPVGKPVYVKDASLALKLRGMDGFEEVAGEAPKEALAPEAPSEKPLEELTKAELLAACEAAGIEAKQSLSKADLVELLKAGAESSEDQAEG